MRILAALILVLFSASPRASAGELTYRWNTDEVMRYRVRAFVVAPSVLRFMAARNVTARAEDIALAMELNCKAEQPQKRTQSWRCSTHRVELGGKAWEGEQKKLAQVRYDLRGSPSVWVTVPKAHQYRDRYQIKKR